MTFNYNDSGRSETGYKGNARDCVTRAISIATDIPYQEVYDNLHDLNREYVKSKRNRVARSIQKKGASPRNGQFKEIYHSYLLELGWTWVPCMKIGSGCKVHLTQSELPPGTLIIKVSRHLTCVVDGVIQDTHDCSREGKRCVYGFYTQINKI